MFVGAEGVPPASLFVATMAASRSPAVAPAR
jgi:hypothetical protein